MVVAKRDILVPAAKSTAGFRFHFTRSGFRLGYNGDSFLGMNVVRQDRCLTGSVEFTQSLRLWRD
jgi:hypothetical protein